MIRVLQNWNELGAAIISLQIAGLPLHETPQKNFDHFLLREALTGIDKNAAIVDLGSGRAYSLAFLHALGFINVQGIDLAVDWRARARQILSMWRERTWVPPFRLARGDLINTGLPDATCDVALSVSTIEHGVDPARFFAEAARILRDGALLFVTTDYWQEKIDTTDASAFGLPWRIFSPEQAAAMIAVAAQHGLAPAGNTDIPACGDKMVAWQGRFYTTLAMLFKKCESRS